MYHGLSTSSSSGSTSMRGEQLFVSVIYDFEYISEEGKRVFMKENEILLLINKTNHDWWQVIRRGDRRPFYAPAKYVAELRPSDHESGHQQQQQRRELKSRVGTGGGGGIPWPYNANKNRPVFTTFGGGGVGISKPPSPLTKESSPSPTYGSGNSKRHSYASPGSRFHERYRSNSLDSILVADLDRSQQAPAQPVRHSYHINSGPPAYHIYPPEHHLIPKSQVTLIRGGMGLAKRPTIEGLDKRKSWSLDISSSRVTSSLNSIVSVAQNVSPSPSNLIGSSQSKTGSIKSNSSRISSYQNTDGLVGIGTRGGDNSNSSKTGTDPRNRKKPVPLPRSKLPAAEKVSSPPQQQSQQQLPKMFQRSKTDLGSDALSKYKAKRSPGGPGGGSKYPAPKVPMFNRPIPQKRTVPSTSPTISEVPAQSFTNHQAASNSASRTQRPVLKEKPAFSTFKTSKKVDSDELKTTLTTKLSTPTAALIHEARMSRAASEGDILGQLIEEETSKEMEIVIQKEKVQQSASPELIKKVSKTEEATSSFSSRESDFNKKTRSEPLTITSEPLVDKTSLENISEWMDKSCSTSFESNEGSMSMLMSTTNERSTDVSMEEQDLYSLESCVVQSGDSVLGGQDRLLMSPCSTTSRSPPSPVLGMTPKRQVTDEWDEYEDGLTGRKFYYNPSTREKSWKPPRKSKGSSEAGYSAPTSPCPESSATGETICDGPDVPKDSDTTEPETKVPDGYERKTSVDNGSSYFVNVFTGVRWYSAETDAGKVYYYEENGNESCWVLPNVSQTIQDNDPTESPKLMSEAVRSKSVGNEIELDNNDNKDEDIIDDDDAFQAEVTFRAAHKRFARPATAMPAINRPSSASRPEVPRLTLPVSSPNFQIGKVNIIILKQGPLNKTKLIENGKKHRKNWTNSHVVLTDTFLLFFKDAKTFASMQSGSLTKPDHCIDLKGATVAWCTSDKSKRNNVFEVTTALLGITILLQDADVGNATDWFKEIGEVADRLTRRYAESLDPSTRRKGSDSNQQTSTLQLPVRKLSGNSAAGSKVNRTTSLKLKFMGSANEVGGVPPPPPSGASVTLQHQQSTNKVNIREKLRKFFMRRPAMDDLFRRGIMKNEPVFGSTLRELQATDLTDVPLFVKKCIAEIEKGDLLKTDGVYRQSGNLSHIQKIRFQVDQGNLAILETVDDVHVLTGALKLFFRELKEPLILWEVVDRLLLACNHQSRKVKLKQMKDCIMALPKTHRETLAYLLRHLIRVTELKETNRMQIPNMAIVFGPTLMWPPSTLVSHNLALSMMQQNIIVEALLNNVDTIFDTKK